jgi:hypothetical protein
LIIDPSSQQEFSDADLRIVDNGDQSKKLAFEVSGIATGTTRTITVPNADMSFSSAFATFLNSPSSANFAALLSDESGTAGTVPFHQTGTYTPTITAVSGAFNTVTGMAGNYIKIGSLVLAWYSFTTNNIGTAAIGILVSTPFTALTRGGGAYRNGATGAMGSVTLNTGTTMLQQQYNGGFGAANGDSFAGFMTFNA